MPTWPEARAAKSERDRREHRFYTPDLLGRPCSEGCGLRVPLALTVFGMNAHPTCGRESARQMRGA